MSKQSESATEVYAEVLDLIQKHLVCLRVNIEQTTQPLDPREITSLHKIIEMAAIIQERTDENADLAKVTATELRARLEQQKDTVKRSAQQKLGAAHGTEE
jgi:hypothetical protein